MTTPTPLAFPGATGVLGPAGLRAAAAAAGLAVSASASWPETDFDAEVSPLAGFIESLFSPLIAEVAGRALSRRDQGCSRDQAAPDGVVIAIVLVTARGDVASAAQVAARVDAGRRVPPLHFFQSVPNAVAGYLAARWQLTGPIVCVSGITAAIDAAALLIEDADADEALIVSVDLGLTGGAGDRAAAVIVTGPTGRPEAERHGPEGAA
ncbi:MAG: hypothetical protein ACRDPY_09205 [Streptosporangiaceae bacterium]